MNINEWKWLNKSSIIETNGELSIIAPAKTDWFNNPIPENGILPDPVANAPFFYTDVRGDFVFRAKVRPNHRYTYDACALMVIKDEKMWAKAAFEKSDFGTKPIRCRKTQTDAISTRMRYGCRSSESVMCSAFITRLMERSLIWFACFISLSEISLRWESKHIALQEKAV